jgi:hypothetical protein
MNPLNIDPTPEDLSSVLEQRDRLVTSAAEFKLLKGEELIENEAIRELGQIVLQSTNEETTLYSCT